MYERAPLRVRPAEGEPPGWLFQRLAHRNGFEDTGEFARCFRTSADDIRRGLADDRLAELSGIPASVVSEWSPQDRVTSVTLRGQVLRAPYDWASGMPGKPARACPECLRADLDGRAGPKASRPYVRAWWCLRDVHHCHVHGCMLVERSGPGARKFAGQGARRGGARPFWIDFVDVEPERADLEATGADLYVLGRMGLVPHTPHAVLDPLPLGEASAILSWLGELAVTGTVALDVRALPFAEAMSVRSRGLAMTENWPSRILGRLGEVVDANLKPAGATLGGLYGRFYRRLYDDRMMRDGHEGRELLRVLLAGHAIENVPFQRGDTIFKRPADDSKRVTLNHAAQIAGVTPAEFAGIAGWLDLLEPGRQAVDRRGVTRRAAEAVRHACDGTLRVNELALKAGVSMAEVNALRVQGHIAPVAGWSDEPRYHRYRAHVAPTLRSMVDAPGFKPPLRS